MLAIRRYPAELGPEPIDIDETDRLRLLEGDEKLFGLDAISAETSEYVDGIALALDLTLASHGALLRCEKVPLKHPEIHISSAASIGPRLARSRSILDAS